MDLLGAILTAFVHAGLLDVLRTALALGLGWALWTIRLPSLATSGLGQCKFADEPKAARIDSQRIRPIADFASWGARYPFIFCILSVFVLVIWGVIGRDYGMQGLFFDRNDLVQFGLGATAALLMLQVIYQYYALNSERPEVWLGLVERVVLVGLVATQGRRDGRSLFASLPNGLLEELDSRRLAIVHKALQVDLDRAGTHSAADSAWAQEVGRLLATPWMRIRFAPAALLSNTTIMFVLLGLIPSLGYPRDRLPWLTGVLCGIMLAVGLAWSTTWLLRRVHRPDAPGDTEALLKLIDSDPRAPKYSSLVDEVESTSDERGSDPRFMIKRFLWLFSIHALNYAVIIPFLSDHFVVLRAMNAPTDSSALLVPLAVLGLELVLAAALATRKLRMWEWFSHGQVRVLRACGADMRWIVLVMAGLWAIPLGYWIYGDQDETIAALLLGAYLVFWLLSFLIGVVGATWLEAPRHDSHAERPLNQIASGPFTAVVLLAGLASLLFWAERREAAIWPICIAAMGLMLGRVWSRARANSQRAIGNTLYGKLYSRAIVVAICMIITLAAGRILIGRFDSAVACLLAYMMACASCLLPIWAGPRPGMIYPASALFCYAAFAILYNGCSEEVQAGLPAAASFMMLLGVLVAGSFILRFSHRRIAPFSGLVLIAAILLANGNSWLVEPNHFKLQFPGLEAYYRNAWPETKPRLSPVYLDSRAYFRSTTSRVVKLRDKAAVKQEDERSGQVDSERPASVTFEWPDLTQDSSDDLVLRLLDTRGRVRPATGDSLSLILPEVPLSNGLRRGDTWVFPIQSYESYVKSLPTNLSPEVPNRAQGSDAFRRWLFGIAKQIRVRPYVPEGGDGKSRFTGVETLRLGAAEKAFEFKFDTDPSQVERSGIIGELELRGIKGEPPEAILVALELTAEVRDPNDADKSNVKGLTRESDHITVVIPLQESLGELRDKPELSTRLRQQLDGSNLVLERDSWPLPEQVTQTAIDALIKDDPTKLKRGDCVVLELHMRHREQNQGNAPRGSPESHCTVKGAETVVPVETFVIGDGIGLEQQQADQVGFNASAVKRTLGRASQNLIDSKLDFELRVAHTRGVFRGTPAGATSAQPGIILYRGDRVRNDDRLLLRWRDSADPGLPEHCQCVKVSSLAPAALPAPPNSRAAYCEPIDPANGTPWAQGPIVGRWEILMPLDSAEVLEAWRERMQLLYRWESENPEQLAPAVPMKPPAIIVTVSGGGIRASIWAATVLKRLQKELGPTFPYHVRLITGASGGMVSASQFAAALPEPSSKLFEDSEPENRSLEGLTDDQLDSVLGCLVYNDIPGLLNPLRRQVDRGRKLEETWHRLTNPKQPDQSPLAQPIRSYAADERAGWRPSLVLTPMLVEDGRRLLISNLDLSFVSRNYGRILLERGETGLDPSYFEDLVPNSAGYDEELFSLSAVEFWRLFPRAWDFQLSTAIRMSASFPWASPAVSLPTIPPRRVVDAGYYDNYGVNLAALWMTKLRQWLAENTSGVLLIQIRDHVSQLARTQINFDLEKDPEYGAFERITWLANRALFVPGIYPLSTPLNGISSAQQWSMSFRNDEQVEVFDRILQEAFSAKPPDFFRTVVFECPVEVSLSWKLDDHEERMIKSGLGDPSKKPIDDFLNEKSQVLELLDQARSLSTDAASNDVYRDAVKQLYHNALIDIGYSNDDIGGLSFQGVENLYTSVLNNTLRLKAVKGWWNGRGRRSR
jgi:hypothetical protein